MDFTFIDELMKMLKGNNIFSYIIIGSKALALTLLTFKFIENFIREIGGENVKLNNLTSYLAYAVFILASDFIPNLIESSFLSLDKVMGSTSTSIYSDLNIELVNQYNYVMDGAEGWMDYIGIVLSSITFIINYIVASLLCCVIYIADMSITSSYLLIRVFLIEFMKMVFPIIIALSTLDITKDLLGRWIKKYIGLFVLGVAYIGIVHFTALMQMALQNQFMVHAGENITGYELGTYAFGMIITIVVGFTVKVKLFATVTSYVSSLFS